MGREIHTKATPRQLNITQAVGSRTELWQTFSVDYGKDPHYFTAAILRSLT